MTEQLAYRDLPDVRITKADCDRPKVPFNGLDTFNPKYLNMKTTMMDWSEPITAKEIKKHFSIIHDDCPVKIIVGDKVCDVAKLVQLRTSPGEPIVITLVPKDDEGVGSGGTGVNN